MVGDLAFSGLVIITNKLGNLELTEVQREYLIGDIGSDLAVVEIAHRDLVPPEPAEVRVLDGDGDEHWDLNHHRVEEGADQGHAAAGLQVGGEVEEDLLQDLGRQTRESSPGHSRHALSREERS